MFYISFAVGDRGRDHGGDQRAGERLVHDGWLLRGAVPRDLDVRRLAPLLRAYTTINVLQLMYSIMMYCVLQPIIDV